MIDDLLAEAARRSLRLNNLFQRQSGSWWAEFAASADHSYGSASASGATAFEALRAALDKHADVMELFS